MKLTKSKIKQIINEEAAAFFEGAGPCPSPLACPGETEEAEAMTQMGQGMSALQEDDALTDQMADCLERIINAESKDDIFATLSDRTVEELETLHDMIMSGRVQLEEDEQENEKETQRRMSKAVKNARRMSQRAKELGITNIDTSPFGRHLEKKAKGH
tara:strand:- start:31 stop:504 length:474 start_codon:yes stop_codon:yes gene_type:complete